VEQWEKQLVYPGRYNNFSVATSPGNGMIIAAPGRNRVAVHMLNANGELGVVLTGIKEDFRGECVPNLDPRLFPNPANSLTSLTFELPLEQTALLKGFDLQGRLVFDKILQPGVKAHPLDLSRLPSGSYMLRLETCGTAAVRTLNVVK
jgi:hypothetical protein